MSIYFKFGVLYLIIAVLFFGMAYYIHNVNKMLSTFYDGFEEIKHNAEETGSEAQEAGGEGTPDAGEQAL